MISTAAIIAALSMGLLGSFHCIGMCGAIAISLPLNEQSTWSRLAGGLLYNLGRISMYGLIGLVFGSLGLGFSIVGLQQSLSILLGVTILIAVFFPPFMRWLEGQNKYMAALQQWLRSKMASLFKKNNAFALVGIGLMNGLLPCGLVYIAVAGALSTGDTLGGMLYMMLFGLGTLPMMLLASQFRGLVPTSVRNKVRMALPYLACILALLFILRGMNLGIPYVSPILQHEATAWILPGDCH